VSVTCSQTAELRATYVISIYITIDVTSRDWLTARCVVTDVTVTCVWSVFRFVRSIFMKTTLVKLGKVKYTVLVFFIVDSLPGSNYIGGRSQRRSLHCSEAHVV